MATSYFRRAGANILRVLANGADAAADNVTFTFTTGAVITATKVTAFLEWEEIKFQ